MKHATTDGYLRGHQLFKRPNENIEFVETKTNLGKWEWRKRQKGREMKGEPGKEKGSKEIIERKVSKRDNLRKWIRKRQ